MVFYIKKVIINGFALFNEKKEIEFGQNLNVIVGNNGSCKTILMEIIYNLLNNDINELEKYMLDKIDTEVNVYLKFKNTTYEKYFKYIHEIIFLKNKLNLNENIKKIIDTENFDKENEINISNFELLNCIVKISFFGKDIKFELIHNNCNLIEDKKVEQYENREEINNINKYILKYYNNSSFNDFIKTYRYDSKTNFVLKDSLGQIDISFFKNILENFIKQNTIYFSVYTKFDNELMQDIKLYENASIKNKISNKFYEITEKHLNVKFIKDKYGYENLQYFIYNNKNENENEYNCSYGEIELVNFLASYYSTEKHVLLFDEPCCHLSSQNKIKIRNFLNGQKEKQIIMITHDIDLVDPLTQNFIYFSNNSGKLNVMYGNIKNNNITNDNTINNSINNKFNIDEIKLLQNEKNILFCNNFLLVEGYNDFKFMNALFNVGNFEKLKNIKYDNVNVINDVKNVKNTLSSYNIIICGGKTNIGYIYLLDKMKLNFKIMYDSDIYNEITQIDVNDNNNNEHVIKIFQTIIVKNNKIDELNIIKEKYKIKNKSKNIDVDDDDLNKIRTFLSDNNYNLADDNEKIKNIFKKINVKIKKDSFKKDSINTDDIKKIKEFLSINNYELTNNTNKKISDRIHKINIIDDENQPNKEDYIKLNDMFKDNGIYILNSIGNYVKKIELEDLFTHLINKYDNNNILIKFKKELWNDISSFEITEHIVKFINEKENDRILSDLINFIIDDKKYVKL